MVDVLIVLSGGGAGTFSARAPSTGACDGEVVNSGLVLDSTFFDPAEYCAANLPGSQVLQVASAGVWDSTPLASWYACNPSPPPDTTTTLANQPPVAADDFVETLRTTASFTGNVLANDSDPDPGDAIDGITGVSGNITPWATFTITDFVTGAFTYTLDVNHPSITVLGPGSFLDHVITYTITDGQAVDSGTITIRILGVADPPV